MSQRTCWWHFPKHCPLRIALSAHNHLLRCFSTDRCDPPVLDRNAQRFPCQENLGKVHGSFCFGSKEELNQER